MREELVRGGHYAEHHQNDDGDLVMESEHEVVRDHLLRQVVFDQILNYGDHHLGRFTDQLETDSKIGAKWSDNLQGTRGSHKSRLQIKVNNKLLFLAKRKLTVSLSSEVRRVMQIV